MEMFWSLKNTELEITFSFNMCFLIIIDLPLKAINFYATTAINW